MVKKVVTFQSEGVAVRLTFLDFTLQKEFVPIAGISKVFPVKNTGRNGVVSYSVEIVHDTGTLSVEEFLDLAAAEEVAGFVQRFIIPKA